MKKSFQFLGLALVAALAVSYFATTDAAARITGYLYGDALVIGYPGTTVASISSAGVATVTGVVNTGTLTAAGLTNTGTLANTGAVTAVTSTAGVAVSTASSSQTSLRLRGATATLSTHTITTGDVWYQTSDNKLYVATRTVTQNDAACAGTACYSALN